MLLSDRPWWPSGGMCALLQTLLAQLTTSEALPLIEPVHSQLFPDSLPPCTKPAHGLQASKYLPFIRTPLARPGDPSPLILYFRAPSARRYRHQVRPKNTDMTADQVRDHTMPRLPALRAAKVEGAIESPLKKTLFGKKRRAASRTNDLMLVRCLGETKRTTGGRKM